MKDEGLIKYHSKYNKDPVYYSKFDKYVCVKTAKESFDKVFDQKYDSVIKYNPVNNERINHLADVPIDVPESFVGKKIICSVGRFGAEKGNSVIKTLMEFYESIHFLKLDGTCDLTPCPVSNSEILKKSGFEMNGKLQNVDGFIILPKEYLNPVNNGTNGVITKTKKTVSVHHYASSWCNLEERDNRNKVWKKIDLKRI